MILRQFPGTSRSPAEDKAILARFGCENVVVHAWSNEIIFTEHTAPLSIKAVLAGREVYEIDGYPLAVTEDTYLIVNDEQPYASYIRAETAVESFCLFFRSGLARETMAAFTLPTEKLLDDPQHAAQGYDLFFQHLRRRDEIVSPLLRRLQAGIMAGEESGLWVDERFHEMMEAMLRLQQHISAEIDELPAVRRATREELYRRVQRAKDYLESCYHERLTLAQMARVACLSQHHFMRLFKHMFRVTPHQYLREIRLQKAHDLLARQDCSVTEAYLSVGYENASAFSRTFKQKFGLPPQQVRPRFRS